MSSFTIRVELHKATPEDYDILHDEMKKEGFSRTIKDSSSGKEYHLPTAEYNKYGSDSLTKDDVLEAAKRAATKTGKNHSILVTKSDGRIWHNLDPVK